MARFLKCFVGLLVVLFILLIIGWNMLPGMVSSKLSERAKVAISIRDIGLSPWSISINRLKVANPSGSILPEALKISNIDINVPMTHFFHKEIVIPTMTLDQVYLALEFDSPKSTNGNWTTIMGNLTSDNGGPSSSKKDDSDRSVLIKHLVLTNVEVDLAYKSTEKVQRLAPISRIDLYDISSTGGIPSAQIMNIVMEQILRNVFSKENLRNMLQDVLTPGSKSNQFLDRLKDLFDRGSQVEGDVETDELA